MRSQVIPILAVVIAAACSKKEPAKDQPAGQPASTTPPASPTTPAAPSTTSVETGPALDPCSLLSATDVEAATGQKSEPKVPEEKVIEGYKPPPWPKYSRCVFTTTGELKVPVVTIEVTTHESAAKAKGMWDFIWKDKDPSIIQPIQGIGEAAHWSDEGSHVEFRKGRYVVDINSDFGDERERELSIALAKKAVTKVP